MTEDKMSDLPKPKCDVCKDTGWTGWEKPMSDIEGKIHLVFVPQRCMMCDLGRFNQQVNIPAP
jgi:hypothetical protein